MFVKTMYMELKEELEQWLENNPDKSIIFITKRPSDMSFELYKEVRKSAKRVLKDRLSYASC